MSIKLRLSLQKQDPSLVTKITKLLSEMGFKVENQSELGISFTGKEAHCSETFGEGVSDRSKALTVPENIKKITGANEASVYIPTPSKIFHQK